MHLATLRAGKHEAYKIAKKIASHGPVAVTLTRHMMYRNAAQSDPVEAHKVDSLAMFYTSIGSGKEGEASFLEERPADYADADTDTDTDKNDMPDFCPWWEQSNSRI